MIVSDSLCSDSRYDVVLVGAGIMSATLAILLHELDPGLRLLLVERLEEPGLESSSAVNNAGTGHAANCELNYTPMQSDGTLSIAKAIAINASFERTLEFWSSLTEEGKIDPEQFLHLVPHISFVWGEAHIDFLRKRFEKLREFQAFSEMKWSNDLSELNEWMPLVMSGRSSRQLCAATKVDRGTDIDFGALTNAYIDSLLATSSIEFRKGFAVIDLNRQGSSGWRLTLKDQHSSKDVYSKFVFLGAGGGALPLLQKSGIPEASLYGGFPVSGKWLVCSDEALTSRHYAKVYGKAKVGSPPMSVPHLDSRWIKGNRSLLFGPYAGFSSKFLKKGSRWDLLNSVSPSNIGSMFQVGINNFDLITYLFGQIRQTHVERFNALKEFLPKANSKDWKLSVAGQRVQIIKRTTKGGVLQMGTEVVTSADGSLAALLGASPGASTSVEIMLEVLRRCWSDRLATDQWQKRLSTLFPSYGKDLNADSDLFIKVRQRSDSILRLV